MIKCFILSRPADFGIALRCQGHMQTHGWHATILIDPREWQTLPDGVATAQYSTLGKGMYGNDCATGILDGILNHSLPGDRVVKTDCDVWLSPEAAHWIAQPGSARALNVLHRRRWQQWGGLWSASREHVANARRHSDTAPRCQCAESLLTLQSLHAVLPGCDVPQWATINQWTAGDRGYAATLPIRRSIDRDFISTHLFE